jgi:hypothetical protein
VELVHLWLTLAGEPGLLDSAAVRWKFTRSARDARRDDRDLTRAR